MIPEIFTRLAVALGLGLLVGLQRERVDSAVAGIRTFALITLFGAIAAQLGKAFGGWVVAAGLLCAAALVIGGNLARISKGDGDPGQTTAFAALVMYGVGAWVVAGSMAVPIVIGGAVAVLLHMREPLHRFVEKIGEDDLKGIMQFVLISLVVLPVLPNRDMGPYGVLNPYEIWWMVVLIVGLSLAGYVAYKILGANAGAALGGVLGGLVSSTATTASYARRTQEEPEGNRLAAMVVMIASTVVYVRVLVEIAAVAPRHLRALGPPIGAMLALSVAVAAAVWFLGRKKGAELPPQENPAELKPAVLFGVLYAVVLLAVAFARDRFGTAGLYAVAALSGLTDMDAITLSTARTVQGGGLSPDTGWRAIVLASLSNLLFKAGIVAALGSRGLLAWIAALFGIVGLGGGLILWLWP